MAVDEVVQTLLETLAEAGGPRFVDLSAPEAREWFAQFRRPLERTPPIAGSAPMA